MSAAEKELVELSERYMGERDPAKKAELRAEYQRLYAAWRAAPGDRA